MGHSEPVLKSYNSVKGFANPNPNSFETPALMRTMRIPNNVLCLAEDFTEVFAQHSKLQVSTLSINQVQARRSSLTGHHGWFPAASQNWPSSLQEILPFEHFPGASKSQKFRLYSLISVSSRKFEECQGKNSFDHIH